MAKPQVVQLSMFGEEQRKTDSDDPSNGIVWSYSRRSALEECARRFYYEYFGANKKSVSEIEQKDHLNFLKKIQNRHLRAGRILHLVIKIYFNKAKEGEMWNSDRMTNWAKDIFSEDHRFSKSYRRGDELPKGKYPPVLLREFYYNENDAEDTYHTTEERLIQAILTFAKDESLNEFRVWGASSSSVVEGKIEQYNPLGKITGQVDLAFQYQGLTKVIDWKLGGEEKGEESLQLSVYGLWATDYYKCKPEDLRVMKIHLSKGHVTFFKVNADVLANATARIIQDMNRMEVMNMYGRRGNQAAFTPCLQASVCRLCSFYEVCYA